MSYFASERRYPMWACFVLLAAALHLNCGDRIHAEQGRRVLEEAAEAMGGMETLRAIENITRQGNVKRARAGQSRLASERWRPARGGRVVASGTSAGAEPRRGSGCRGRRVDGPWWDENKE